MYQIITIPSINYRILMEPNNAIICTIPLLAAHMFIFDTIKGEAELRTSCMYV